MIGLAGLAACPRRVASRHAVENVRALSQVPPARDVLKSAKCGVKHRLLAIRPPSAFSKHAGLTSSWTLIPEITALYGAVASDYQPQRPARPMHYQSIPQDDVHLR